MTCFAHPSARAQASLHRPFEPPDRLSRPSPSRSPHNRARRGRRAADARRRATRSARGEGRRSAKTIRCDGCRREGARDAAGKHPNQYVSWFRCSPGRLELNQTHTDNLEDLAKCVKLDWELASDSVANAVDLQQWRDEAFEGGGEPDLILGADIARLWSGLCLFRTS